MIARIWHGWTAPENADAYEDFLRTTMFPSIHRNDYERAVIEPEARALLSRCDERSEHYEVVLDRA